MDSLACFAGMGLPRFSDGHRTAATFFFPSSLCSTPTGELYVADSGNNRIRFINKHGYVSTYAGTGKKGRKDGGAFHSTWNNPCGIALSSNGNLIISDTNNHIIRIITVEGTVKTYVGSGKIGDQEGVAEEASFNYPTDLCISSNSTVFVSDTGNHKIREISTNRTVKTLTGSTKGYKDGTKDVALFNAPFGIRIQTRSSSQPTSTGSFDSLIIADSGNHCIRLLENGHVTTIAGRNQCGFKTGLKHETLFNKPIAICLSESSTDACIYVSDANNNAVYVIQQNGDSHLLAGGRSGCQDGNKQVASFKTPGSLCLISEHRIIMAETGNGRILLIKPDGSVMTFAGRNKSVSREGPVLESTFFEPFSVFAVSSNDLLISDTKSNKIRRITNGIVSTYAGSSESGMVNGRKDVATFNCPTGIYIAPNNSVYISDSNNHVIRKIKSDQIAIFAGSGSKGFLDGPVDKAMFSHPLGLSMTNSGSLLICDSGNHRIRIVSKDNIVYTFSGSGTPGYQDGPGLEAKYHFPCDILLSPKGIIYISDRGNHSIRAISPNGTVSTLAGNGTKGYLDGSSSVALFNNPQGLSITPESQILVADSGNRCVRIVSPHGNVETIIPAKLKMLNKPGSTSDDSVSLSSTHGIPKNLLTSLNTSCDILRSDDLAIDPQMLTNELTLHFDYKAKFQPCPSGISLTSSGVLFITDVVRNQIFYVPCPHWDVSKKAPVSKDHFEQFTLRKALAGPSELSDFSLTHLLTGTHYYLHKAIIYARCPLLLDASCIQMVQTRPSREALDGFLHWIYSESLDHSQINCDIDFLDLLMLCKFVDKPTWVEHFKQKFLEILYCETENLDAQSSGIILKFLLGYLAHILKVYGYEEFLIDLIFPIFDELVTDCNENGWPLPNGDIMAVFKQEFESIVDPEVYRKFIQRYLYLLQTPPSPIPEGHFDSAICQDIERICPLNGRKPAPRRASLSTTPPPSNNTSGSKSLSSSIPSPGSSPSPYKPDSMDIQASPSPSISQSFDNIQMKPPSPQSSPGSPLPFQSPIPYPVLSSHTSLHLAPDFIIQLGEKRIPCHKVILYSRVPYFARLVEESPEELQSGSLNLPADLLSQNLLFPLIHYIYSNSNELLPKDEKGCLQLLRAGKFFEYFIKSETEVIAEGWELLVKHCQRHLIPPVTLGNCLEVLSNVVEVGSVPQENSLISFIGRNLKQIMETSRFALAMATLPSHLHTRIMFSHFSSQKGFDNN